MEKIQVEVNEALKIMKEINVRQAMGPESVAGWILKEYAEQLLRPIYIIKSSLNEGVVPQDWKTVNTVPIYMEDPINYRPVSLTRILCM